MKVTGVVENRGTLMASPVGGHPCIGFSLVIQAKAAAQWEELVRREECRSFTLTDETGTVVIDGPFRLALDVDDGAWVNLPSSVYTLLEEALGKRRAWAYAGRDSVLRFQEALLKPGDRISVHGRPTMELDPAGRGSYRDPPMRDHIRGSDEDPVTVADAEEPAV